MRIAQNLTTATCLVHIRYRHVHITSTPFRSHDVLARFRRPSSGPQASNPSLISRTVTASDSMPGTFQTSSTEPAGMSFQQVSSPDTVSIGPGHLAVQVPAMREDAPSLEVPQNTGSEGHHHIERKILGVTILPRPRPPAEEGTSTRIQRSSFARNWGYYTYLDVIIVINASRL